jgi:RsiW-degrading membrane proteinase PrsW (M82 family)
MAVASPQLPTPGRQRRTVLGTVVILVVFGVCGLLVLGFVSGSIGVGAVLVGALGALVPVGPVVWAFLWIDRWEPEPARTLLFAFLWGACVAALTALIINSSAAYFADAVLGQGSGDVLGATVIAPFVEEGVKGAFVVGLLLFRRREFDGVVDGVVYAGLTAAGFAFTENILYIGQSFAEDGGGLIGQNGGVLATLVLRGVLSPFAHPLFTSMTGIGCGLAATSRSPAARVLFVLVGYLAAVTLHALWNGSATLADGQAFFGVYLYVMLPLLLGMFLLVGWQRRREQRTVRAELPEFAQAGWIAPSEVPLLGSLAGRNRWRRAVRRRSGKTAAKAVAEYQTAVTELAFLRARMRRGTVGPHARQWHDELLAALVAARARAMGQPQALTAAWLRPPPPGWAPPPPPPPGWRPNPSPPQGWGGQLGGWGPPPGSGGWGPPRR